jgi:hypothetical protein
MPTLRKLVCVPILWYTLSMSDRELYAYTAGIIDGEGYISLLPVWHSRGYIACVKVSSVDPYMTVFMHDNYGGNLGKPRIHKPPQRPSRQWALRNNARVGIFLRKIYPYLRVKKAQADIVLEYIDSFSQHSPRNPEIWGKKDVLYKQVKLLNRRGIAPAETE